MGDRSGMSISTDSPLDETLNRGPLVLLLLRQYEFSFGISLVQFFFHLIVSACYQGCTGVLLRDLQNLTIPSTLVNLTMAVYPWEELYALKNESDLLKVCMYIEGGERH